MHWGGWKDDTKQVMNPKTCQELIVGGQCDEFVCSLVSFAIFFLRHCDYLKAVEIFSCLLTMIGLHSVHLQWMHFLRLRDILERFVVVLLKWWCWWGHDESDGDDNNQRDCETDNVIFLLVVSGFKSVIIEWWRRWWLSWLLWRWREVSFSKAFSCRWNLYWINRSYFFLVV